MKYQKVTEEEKKQIMDMKAQGLSMAEISEKMNLSLSGTYRIVQSSKTEDNDSVKELKERIRKLEEENENLRNDVRRLTDKLLSLI